MSNTGKKTGSDQIMAQVLGATNRDHQKVTAVTDPVTPQEMTLNVSDIHAYDMNPRTADNEKYEDIKTSIRARGYSGVLEITRRPGDENYMVASGGNTTLTIIKELYEETGDTRFRKIRCLFKPWENESVVLFNHLIENDSHGKMIFIDRATGIINAKKELESELDKKLSSREFCRLSNETKGYKVDVAVLSRLTYAHDILLPLIPEALSTGMGRPQVERIRKLHSSFEKYVDYKNQSSKEHEEAFFNVIEQSDSDLSSWSYDALQKNVEQFLSELLNEPLQNVRLDLATLLSKGKIEKQDALPSSSDDSSDNVNENTSPTTTPATQTATPKVDDGNKSGDKAVNQAKPTVVEPQLPQHASIEEIRAVYKKSVYEIATFFGIQDLVFEVGTGPGVYIELPEQPFSGVDDPITLPGLAWFVIASHTEQSMLTQQSVDAIPEATRYKFHVQKAIYAFQQLNAGQEVNDNELYVFDAMVASEPQYGSCINQLLSSVNDEVFDAIQALTKAHAQLLKEVDNTIWEVK